ncbi:DUF916 and DUF3324 domain-containing protein [Companilactobacillus sp. HBUAS59699]|uniref:DUF916 and DUF3324 domain-containing protein n=1 Tax=Companilactobacillus sp. HBUAS59699 TaxID=3109358 RepID=UPI002FF39C99
MKKLWAALGISIVALLGIFFDSQTVQAENLNFSVSATQADNQIDKKITYFDLLVKPDQGQDLTIKIQNTDSQENKYRVSINRAGTNRNGVIDYSTHGVALDKSLNPKLNLESLVPAPTTVKVPANSTKEYTFHLNVPKKSFSGVILGGVRVQKVQDDDNKKSKGVSIVNQYAYVIGLQLQSNQDYVAPNMKLLNVKAKQYNGRNYINAYLQNPKPTIMHDLSIKARVNTKGTKDKILSTTKKMMTMAPNSNFGFPIETNGKTLKSGKYTLILDATAEKGKYHWHFSRDFAVTNKQASKLDKTSVDTHSEPNYFMWIVIAIIVILILLCIIVYLNQRNQKNRRK